VGALHALPGHPAAVADVRAEVGAVRVEDVQVAAVTPVGRQLLAEVAEGHGAAGREVARPADLEPPGRPPRERNLHRTPSEKHLDEYNTATGEAASPPRAERRASRAA